MNAAHVNELKQSERMNRILAWVVPPILLFIAFVLVSVNQNQVITLNRTKQDVLAQQQTAIDNENFSKYITDRPHYMQMIQAAVPNEEMLVSFLQDMESAVREHDQEGKVVLIGTSPARSGVDLIIPVTIQLTTPMEQLPDLLTTLNKLPYLMQLTSVESNQAEGGARHVIGFKLFVQEPFSGL